MQRPPNPRDELALQSSRVAKWHCLVPASLLHQGYSTARASPTNTANTADDASPATKNLRMLCPPLVIGQRA